MATSSQHEYQEELKKVQDRDFAHNWVSSSAFFVLSAGILCGCPCFRWLLCALYQAFQQAGTYSTGEHPVYSQVQIVSPKFFSKRGYAYFCTPLSLFGFERNLRK